MSGFTNRQCSSILSNRRNSLFIAVQSVEVATRLFLLILILLQRAQGTTHGQLRRLAQEAPTPQPIPNNQITKDCNFTLQWQLVTVINWHSVVSSRTARRTIVSLETQVLQPLLESLIKETPTRSSSSWERGSHKKNYLPHQETRSFLKQSLLAAAVRPPPHSFLPVCFNRSSKLAVRESMAKEPEEQPLNWIRRCSFCERAASLPAMEEGQAPPIPLVEAIAVIPPPPSWEIDLFLSEAPPLTTSTLKSLC